MGGRRDMARRAQLTQYAIRNTHRAFAQFYNFQDVFYERLVSIRRRRLDQSCPRAHLDRRGAMEKRDAKRDLPVHARWKDVDLRSGSSEPERRPLSGCMSGALGFFPAEVARSSTDTD